MPLRKDVLLVIFKGKTDLSKYFNDVYLVRSMVQEFCHLPVVLVSAGTPHLKCICNVEFLSLSTLY